MVVVYRPIYRQKKLPIRIDSVVNFESVWQQMEFLKNKENIKKILKRSIDENFYFLDLDLIKKQRKNNFGNLKCSPKRFIKEKDLEIAASKTLASIKQAHEYYKAAKNASPLTKPVFLYYGMVSLAKAMISSTYLVDKYSGHGLHVNNDFKVTVCKCGEYQIFHDCYLGDTTIYSNETEINLKDLLSVIPGISLEWKNSYEFPKLPDSLVNAQFDMDYDYSRSKLGESYCETINTSNGEFTVIFCNNDEGKTSMLENERFLHVMDAHFLSMYILCHFARYRPLKWIETIENSPDINSYLINAFLRRSELDFPILFYNELTGTQLQFRG
ncbi:MAG: YaaC family protein [Methanobacteriaceae archaeon]|jgi:hypothetical protein|nr:YaaC family protein [Methanobacteriaceae archaeon]